jgi:hypothetical protein
MHDIVGNSVAFFFAQFLAKAAHKFARASQRKSDGETQHVPTSTHRAEENITGTSIQLLLFAHKWRVASVEPLARIVGIKIHGRFIIERREFGRFGRVARSHP